MEKRIPGSKIDDNLVTQDPWKIEEIHRHFPKHTHDEVLEALEDCQREIGDSKDSDKLVSCMKTRLTPQAGDGVD